MKELYQEVGELLYYESVTFVAGGKKDQPASFGKLTQEEQKDWHEKAQQVLRAIDKLNHVVIHKDKIDTWETRQSDLNSMTEIIETFVNNLRKLQPKPFPSLELAHRLREGILTVQSKRGKK